VLTTPPCPVLAIRYGIRKRASLRRVVVPVHFEQKSHTALDLAARLNAEAHLVIVCDEKDTTRAEEHLRTLSARIPGATMRVLQGGDAEKEIVRYAAKADVDAIFLNADKEPTEGKLDIIRHASVPVMVVP
jgi:K+-sensing histidine kinase KdpD